MTTCSGWVPYRASMCVQPASDPGTATADAPIALRRSRVSREEGRARGVGRRVDRDDEILVHVGARGFRCSAEVIYDNVATVRQPDVRDAAAQNADHHWLDHRQREQRRHGSVDRVAAGEQNLGRRSGCKRMVRDDHAARTDRRPLLADKRRRAKRGGDER